MNQILYDKINEGYEWCRKNDKSFEFMIEYLQSYAKTNYDTILKFFCMPLEERIIYHVKQK